MLEFDSLSEGLQAFLKQFFYLKINYSDQDSLSRILEGKDMCAAILILEKKIYITTNSIHSGTITDENKKGKQKPGQYYTYLTRVMSYFCAAASIDAGIREQIFLEICTQRLAQQSKNPYIVSVELRDYIAKELLAEQFCPYRDFG